jgi:hypothetical protein
MRFNLNEASWLPAYTRKRLAEQTPGRVNSKGEYMVSAQTERKQHANHAECIDLLYGIIHPSIITYLVSFWLYLHSSKLVLGKQIDAIRRASFVVPPPSAEQLERREQQYAHHWPHRPSIPVISLWW